MTILRPALVKYKRYVVTMQSSKYSSGGEVHNFVDRKLLKIWIFSEVILVLELIYTSETFPQRIYLVFSSQSMSVPR